MIATNMRSPSHQPFKAIGIGFLCLLLVGCQYDPWADRFLTNQPAEAEVVGTYKVDLDTLARPISKTLSISRNAEIVLSGDHQAKFLQVPELDERTKNTCVIEGTGAWQVGKNDGYSVVNVQIQRRNNSQSAQGCNPMYYGQLMLYGKKPPYKLHLTIGDPDSGEAVQFEKTN